MIYDIDVNGGASYDSSSSSSTDDGGSVDPSVLIAQHSLLVLTNLAILPAIWKSASCRLWLEFVVFLIINWASSLYQLCDSFQYCLYAPETHKWLDFMFATLSAVVIVVYYMNFRNIENKYLTFLLLVLYVALTYAWFGFTHVALWLHISALALLVFTRWWSGRMFKFQWFELVLLTALVTLGMACFLFFNRDLSHYWWVHSIWHVSIMLSAFVALYVKRPPDRPKSHSYCMSCNDRNQDSWILPLPPLEVVFNNYYRSSASSSAAYKSQHHQREEEEISGLWEDDDDNEEDYNNNLHSSFPFYNNNNTSTTTTTTTSNSVQNLYNREQQHRHQEEEQVSHLDLEIT